MNARIGGLAAVLLASTAIPFAAPALGDEGTQENAAEACTAFAQADLGEGVEITSTRWIEAAAPGTVPLGPGEMLDAPLPAHCMVEGMINRREGAGGVEYGIGFAMALPENWEGRFLLQGGGGLNGSVRPPLGPVASGNAPALARHFAVISHDSGHKGAVFDGSFMADQRAALDFAETSVRVVAELGKRIVGQYYGVAPRHSYMTGCSTGGRESMLAMQRYPEMFDGIVIGAPAMRAGYSNFGIEYSTVQFNQAAPRDAESLPITEKIFSTADRQTILKGLLDQCDALDGRADGMIMNVAQCHFQPAKLQCAGEKTDSCLSGAQVSAMERAFAGPKDAAGYPAYVPVPYDTGIVTTDGPLPGYLPTGTPGVFGPASRALEINVDAKLQELRADGNEHLTDTNIWTNLSTFLGHGGKVLFFHGVSDPWFSAYDSWDYWQRAAKANGTAFTDASRYYMVPGMGHCQGGNSFERFDLLGPIVDWVEKDEAPSSVIAWRADGSEKRPMCPHPSYAHYDGGDPAKAESYSCRKPDASS